MRSHQGLQWVAKSKESTKLDLKKTVAPQDQIVGAQFYAANKEGKKEPSNA